ncbi:sensor histidine kinase [Kutzneria buriramensis]|uniref:histidine kinase n=1 Tax=Kutzneria buriramensis TaxID=1045776 RepID=A0A3E0HCK1_9PSEU|nr:histidine kinase [Kutzneria buriramensis]REH42534.1 signal transduction histidine kinase [Kutzneria buriramensis]
MKRFVSWLDSPVAVIGRDAVIAALVGWFSVNNAYTSSYGLLYYGPVAIAVAVAGSAVLAVRSRFPRTVVLLTSLLVVLDGVFTPLLFAVYTLGAKRGSTRSTWLVAAWALVVMLVPWWPGFQLRFRVNDINDAIAAALFPLGFIGFPLLLGLWVWQRRQLVASLRERTRQAELERDMLAVKAVADERTRIARELHDVVAHRVSLLTVQAGAVSLSPNKELAEFAEGIRQNGAAAMEELREMLSVLRREDGDLAPKHPQPTLAAACELIADASAAGQHVQASLPEELPEVPGTTARAVYWLLHESLANTAKHAPGADIEVVLRDHDDRLDVRVANTVGLPRATPVPKSGFGLIGMRERVVLSGGTLAVGPLPGGGFEVAATFPKESR